MSHWRIGSAPPPDHPDWLTVPVDVRCYDANVFRQVGVPEPFLKLAERRCLEPAPTNYARPPLSPDLSFLDELEEDPDARPYTWDIPPDCY
jgi:hypothetical protein